MGQVVSGLPDWVDAALAMQLADLGFQFAVNRDADGTMVTVHGRRDSEKFEDHIFLTRTWKSCAQRYPLGEGPAGPEPWGGGALPVVQSATGSAEHVLRAALWWHAKDGEVP